ncbi:MAG: hypothetical protein NVS9B1_16830 [Candidatus Dormibacteraceae bacterium]
MLPLLVILVAGALVAAGPALRPVAPGAPTTACSPAPCAAPHGFEVDISALAQSGGRATMTVAFKNHTQAAAGSVDYNHTSPDDFQLRGSDGRQVKPIFGEGCPRWSELKIARGATAGPEPLCFPAVPGFPAALLVWGPDLGFLFDDVRIPLG